MKIDYSCQGQKEKRKLMDAITEVTGVARRYTGPPDFSYTIGEYIVDRNGVLVIPEGVDGTALLTALREKGYQGSVIAIHDEDIEETEEKAVISFAREDISDKDLEKMEKIIRGKRTLIMKALGASNIKVVDDGKTVSFPWFERELTPEEKSTYTKFILAIKQMAEKQKRVSMTDSNPENEKYAFRCFLLRLNFIGDDTLADRKILMKNLKGNSSFLSGKRKEQPSDYAY